MLEKQIEAKVCDYAKERGLLVYKFTSPARAAVPDRLFVLPNGKIFFCEFKRGGQKPTQAQEREHHRLRQHKVVVYVIDDVVAGLRMVDDMIEYANP
ncbi:VRR-NUC domain containing protein [uncultured Caudovirales phage]|uniref:VRR-NUC domain containing protein n=1 Tax=uncultured Caudovirales phage TaxID=2100421 RepID=A0A6J5P0S6_9CAUD|nr:VRR-NUC domain containing protein [uncultured Caudovirales phage]CAB4161104.1 VRR-NUC domain containing protein [uncultured Caudovirales phage]